MGAMEINESGMTARDGLSGGVDRPDAIRVGILDRVLSSCLWFNTEKALDLRVAVHTELGAQCALTHAAVD